MKEMILYVLYDHLPFTVSRSLCIFVLVIRHVSYGCHRNVQHRRMSDTMTHIVVEMSMLNR